jgi:glucosamine--fructose-6-phosphate aminotransferase (isomerizing)
VLTEFSVIEGQYLRDILDQSRALQDTLAGLEDAHPLRDIASRLRSDFKAVVLTGMGSSFHALHPLQIELVEHGIPALMLETSELVHYHEHLFDTKTLVVALSQSGQSAEVVRLLKVNGRRSPMIAVTNTGDSPLAKQATAAVVTRAGGEFSVSCKTYVTALMALRWLSDVLRERDLRQTRHELEFACTGVRNYLASWKEHVEELARQLNGIRHLFLVGRGASLAAAGMGGLITKEAAHFHAEGMSCAAFRHGPWEMLGPATFVLIFAGAEKTRDLNLRLLADVREQFGRAELVSEDSPFRPCALPRVPDSVRPILEALPVQMFTLALAAQAGREPGRFERATKITTTE